MDGFLSTTIFSRFFFPFELLVLDEYDESDSLPLDEPEPDELSRFFLLVTLRDEGGEMGFLRFREIGEAAFFSSARVRPAKHKQKS